ncbi:hypothetical protein KY342_05140 [Candidatus Woesearchaeota archaeon]|nr:hypothetical protein [Candidatus Woesearchaeota archaeon]
MNSEKRYERNRREGQKAIPGFIENYMRYTRVGHIGVYVKRRYKAPLGTLRKELKKKLGDKGYFLENTLTMDLLSIIRKEKKDIEDNYSGAELLRHYTERPAIPFCVLDKKSGARIYGFLKVDAQNLNIAEVHYFNTQGEVIHQI